MGFYDTKKGVKDYLRLAEGYDGAELIKWFSKFIPDNASVLELGMGPGKDLDILLRRYRATGSDFSKNFLDHYLVIHPDADVIHLDAITMNTARKFDAIYSNKVLQHLSMEETSESLRAQYKVLNKNGIVLHALWYGEECEVFEGLRFQQYTEDSFARLLGKHFELLETKVYTEMDENDSIAIILKRLSV